MAYLRKAGIPTMYKILGKGYNQEGYLAHAGLSLLTLPALLIFRTITNEPAIPVISNAVDAEIGPAMHGG
jgi:hypothetical protein